MATFLPNVTDVIPEPALFTPNFSFLDTMLRRRQGLYEQGFAQVNSAYNFVNRGVTNPYSVQVRDTFLKQAKDNLKNLSALDLSQQQNVKAASSVFDPFVKNRAVLGDMAFTAHMDQQEAIGDSFRLKDGGKEYSEDNMTYLRQQREAFAKDDISTVNDYYGNRRSFTPYFDWNKEIKDVMKDFKPSSTKIESVNGMYMVTTKDASYTKEEINKYLNATLSDKAKQQMRIEAAVRYPDLNSVAGLYVNQAAQDLPQIDSRLGMINEAIKQEKNTDKLTELKKERDFYTDRSKEIRGNIQSIQQGDVTFLKKNAQRLAENIYMGQTINRLADGFSHKDIEQTIGFNQVAMMYARMAFDREENEKTRNKDKQEFPELTIQAPGVEKVTTLNSLNQDIELAEKERRGKFAELKDIMVNIDPAFTGRTSGSITEQDVEKYIERNPNSKEVRSFVDAGRALKISQSQKENWTLGAETYAKEKMGADWPKYQQYLQEKKSIEAGNAKPEVSWDAVKRTYVETRPSTVAGGAPVTRDIGRFYKEPIAQDATRASAQANYRLMTAPQQLAANRTGISLKEGMALDNTYRNFQNEFNSKRNTVTSVFTPGKTYSVNDPRYKNALGYIEAVTGKFEKIGGIGFFPGATDYGIEFSINDASSATPADRQAILNNLTAKLGGSARYDEKRDVFTIGKIGPQAAAVLDPYYGVDNLHRQVLAENDSFTGSPGSSRPGTDFNINDNTKYTFQIKKLFGNTQQTNKYILLVNNIPIQKTYDSSLEAYRFAMQGVSQPGFLDRLLLSK